MLTLAADTAGKSYFDWYLGLGLAFGVVVVVVAVVALVLTFASRIGDHTGQAIEALEAAQKSTGPLAEVETTGDAAQSVLDAARAARSALGGA